MKQLSFRTLLLLLTVTLIAGNVAAAKKEKQSLNIVFIGNSITQGGLLDKNDAPPVYTCEYLRSLKMFKAVRFSNQGVSGSTTVDFLPMTNNLFTRTVTAADLLSVEEGTLLFSIKLGTNDSAEKGPNGSPVSDTQYYDNMKGIIDSLLSRYPSSLIVLHRATWYSPNTYNGAIYLKAGLKRLNSYTPQLERLVASYAQSHPGHVYQGDTAAYDYFRINYEKYLFPEDGNAGIFYLHPNKEGAKKLAAFWGKGIVKALEKSTGK
ncbi:MAG TPA: GDSL-type esterase/lipase family protein [Bacteroidales bacterium]